MTPWWRDLPEVDEEKVGITFVDVLFALVVGQILTPLQRWWTISATGWSHLAVALVLTIGSWIGYHTSSNRPRYSIRFVNLPLAQFGLDVAMVITYWLTAATVPIPEHSTIFNISAQRASAISETVLVTASFFLYALWDRVSKVMQSKTYYVNAQARGYDPGRRKITVYFGLASACLMGLAIWNHEHWGDQRSWILGIDIGLIATLIAYRGAKELWRLYFVNRKLVRPLSTPATSIAPPVSPRPDLLTRLDQIETKLETLLNAVGPDRR